ncbi:hypothetical protein F5144DRAFT_565692 [Chaetomium tenue]|uniref:Uncharacterized protein n=1 Tax=Chaetomium tenue TaxID=1854479 RepID=A0ACB7PC35_9PEZI|nr:hypothetical protein F5144DRAFT_565692 [Chaetomium globosum]
MSTGMADSKQNDVALTVEKWVHQIRNNNEIRAEVKLPGRFNELAVSQGGFSNSGSSITHTEYLHLRAIWYRYGAKHLDDFADLYRDNDQTGYKGFVSPHNDQLARELVSEDNMSSYLTTYLEEGKTKGGASAYLHPSPECGYFSMVRYWQVMATMHTKGSGTDNSKVHEPQAEKEEARGRPTTPAGEQGSGGPSTVTTPPRQIQPTPDSFRTPAATSHPAAKGGAENPPSADEAYVNVALLLLLQAVAQEFHKHFPDLHWVPPRLALHLKVPVFNSATREVEDKLLLEARVDGYLCRGKAGPSWEKPMAICEAKSGPRRSIQISTERQEAAEMAAWICSHPLNEGLLQNSNSGKKRRLMISQNLNEIYIIIGEYGPSYEQYIRNAPWRSTTPGEKIANPAPLQHTQARLAHDFEETLGSPTFLKQRAQKGIQRISGWDSKAAENAMGRVKATLAPRDGTAGGLSGNGSNSGNSGQAPGTGRVTRSTTAALDLPTVDGFLVMHRFGPWRTDDPANMSNFIRRLLGFMLQLYGNRAASPPNSRSAWATGHHGPLVIGTRRPSTTGYRAPAATTDRPSSTAGSRAPSATGDRATGSRAPSATGRASSQASKRAPSAGHDGAAGSRAPSATGDRIAGSRAPSTTGQRTSSATGHRSTSATASRASSTTSGSRASSVTGDRGRRQ